MQINTRNVVSHTVRQGSRYYNGHDIPPPSIFANLNTKKFFRCKACKAIEYYNPMSVASNETNQKTSIQFEKYLFVLF